MQDRPEPPALRLVASNDDPAPDNSRFPFIRTAFVLARMRVHSVTGGRADPKPVERD